MLAVTESKLRIQTRVTKSPSHPIQKTLSVKILPKGFRTVTSSTVFVELGVVQCHREMRNNLVIM